MSQRYPDWEREGKDWPNRAASHFVSTQGYRWHVQQMGRSADQAPTILLLHGTGAATHSWRDMMPLLAVDHHVIAVDLPGHGFTRPTFQRRVTLPAMAHSIADLMQHLDTQPDLIVGHSAGAAIGAQILLDHDWQVPLIGFTPALMPFPGLGAKIFPSLARVLFTNPFTAIIFSRMASRPGEAEKFLKRATGSDLDAAGLDYYGRLFRHSGHCDGAIRMMANWDLDTLSSRLTELRTPTLLLHAEKDKAIPQSSVLGAAERISDSVTQDMAALGHLAHEEDAEQAVRIIREFSALHL
ncbi:alpha/beta fold hydrolase BchO [Alterisphingorhabdus coralli]|uniref:Alpha/beta fold hydrolase n=1 Tax=Alterisphingorhabdus coralli TaxID=3071408 RepID=A0AA97F773_9SPHN|nr:alpha/beta fold hydrolase BchO [Parasphingorhabdus sp. SCSIO 66989]WOE74512.1 alpha/beta fold hydrolase [Parasphingorhabdus sp. SCSIO 66989]